MHTQKINQITKEIERLRENQRLLINGFKNNNITKEEYKNNSKIIREAKKEKKNMIKYINNYFTFPSNITVDKVENIAKRYGLNISFTNNDTLIVNKKDNNINTWICDIDYENDILILKHQNTMSNKTSKYHSHIQRVFYDFEKMLKSIKEHENYKFGRGFKENRLNRLFSIISAS